MTERTNSISGVSQTVEPAKEAFSDPSAILRTCSERLKELNSLTESDFLSTGRDLETILLGATSISQSALKASEVVNGDDVRRDIEKLSEIFDVINGYFQESQLKLEHSSDALLNMLELVKDARGPLPSFKRIVKHLHILGISTKIENARLVNSDNSFFILAEDVEKLSLVIAEKSEGIFGGLALLKGSIETTLAGISALKDQERGKTRHTLEGIRVILSTLSDKRSLSSETTRDLVEQSNGITRAMSKVISSLQFHDITRQQIEHVAISLDEISRKESDDNILTDIIARIGQLQIDQLNNARGELLSAVQRVMDELRGIAESVSAMSKETKALLAGAGDTGTSFLNELTRSLSSVTSFLMENEDTDRKLSKALRLVSDTIEELSGFVSHIEDIREEIELIALNARVKAAHSAGDGAALDVIAEAIAHLSDGAKELTSVITGALKDIYRSAATMNSMKGEIVNDLEGGIRGLAADAERLSQSAQRSDESVTSLLTNLEKETMQLTWTIDTTTKNITVHVRTDKEIKEILDEMRPLVAHSRSVVPEEGNEKTREYVDNLAARYTMHQERHIHQAHINGVDDPVLGSIEGSEEEHFGDNVELF